MKISFLIPTYQGEKKLSQIINSLNKQTNKHYEAIFIVDGINDNSIKIIQKFQKKFPKKIKVLINGIWQMRITSIFNGLNECTGDYVVICSPKEKLNANFITKITSIINSKSPDIIEFSVKCISGKDWEFPIRNKKRKLLRPQNDFSILANIVPIDFNKVVKKSLLESISHLEYLDGDGRFGFSLAFNMVYIAHSYYATSTVLKEIEIFNNSLINSKRIIAGINQSISRIKMIGNMFELKALQFLVWYTLAIFQMRIILSTKNKVVFSQFYNVIKKVSKDSFYQNAILDNSFFESNLLPTKILRSLPTLKQYRNIIGGIA